MATRTTFAFVHGQPCNVVFIWDDEGPGLQVTWCEDKTPVDHVVRSDEGLNYIGAFASLTELLGGC